MQEKPWLERKMLAWFSFPFQLVNKLNLRLPQIAVKDKLWKAFAFHSCRRHLHPRCDSQAVQMQTQRLSLSVPSTGAARAAGLPEERTEGQHQPSLLRMDVFFRFTLMKNMTRYLQKPLILDIPHVWREDIGKENKTVPECRWSYDFFSQIWSNLNAYWQVLPLYQQQKLQSWLWKP